MRGDVLLPVPLPPWRHPFALRATLLLACGAASAGGGEGRRRRPHLKPERRLRSGDPSGWRRRGMAEWELSLARWRRVVGAAGEIRRTGGDGTWKGGFAKRKTDGSGKVVNLVTLR